MPASFVVTNTNNSGAGSFAKAIADSNDTTGTAFPGPDTITFDPSVFASPTTINLTSQLQSVIGSVTITGTGSANLTIKAATSGFRLFDLGDGIDSTSYNIAISGMTISSFNATGVSGGGVRVAGETVSFNDVVFDSCTSTTGGGGLSANNSAASTSTIGNSSLTITNCKFINNLATNSGGGIRLFERVSATISNSTISNNAALLSGTNYAGGGICVVQGFAGSVRGSLTLNNVVVSNNSTNFGGGIRTLMPTTITNSQITGNSATNVGGGISNYYPTTISNSTISSNVITGTLYGAGAVARSSLSLNNVVFGSNSAPYAAGFYADSSSLNVSLSSVTFTGNSNSSAGTGGTMYLANGASVTMTNSAFTSNTAGFGSAILMTANATLNATSTTFGSNTTTTSGGAIYQSSGSNLTLTGATFSNNSATFGAALFEESAISNLTIRNSLFSGNSATTNGGAIEFTGGPTGATRVQNSTFVNNTAGTAGGAIYVSSGLTSGKLQLQNLTITGNTAPNGGGGVFVASDVTGVVQLDAVLAAGNQSNDTTTSTLTPVDVEGPVTANKSLIAASRATITGGGNITGTSAAPVNAKLGTLANNGGATQTVALLTGSPAIDAGSNVGSLATDQRGSGFARTFGTSADIGAFEVQPAGTPTADGTNPDILSAGATSVSISVNYGDDVAISYGSVTTSPSGTIFLTAPDGSTTIAATLVSASPSSDNKTITATYKFTPPGGSITGASIGTYSISINSSKVSDTSGNFVPGGGIGTFTVIVPATIQVTTLSDVVDANDGVLSLREAVLKANANSPAADSITFASSLFTSGPQTITLTGSEMLVTDAVSIIGPGSASLTLDGGNITRILRFNGPGTMVASVTGLTLTQGSAGTDTTGLVNGGALRIANESVTLTDVVVKNSAAPAGDGGGIYVETDGFLILNKSSVINNTAGDDGGGIGGLTRFSLTATDTTFSGNTATSNGGGIYFGNGGTANILRSTISGNTAADGGGLYFYGTIAAGGALVRNTTIAGNTASGLGGGVALETFSGNFQVVNSTITGNNALNGGGIGDDGYGAATRQITVTSSIVSGNTTNSAADIFSTASVNLTYSAVGTSVGFTPSASSANNLAFGTNLLLGSLSSNGGLTQTVPLLVGSPAIGKGTNPAITTPSSAAQTTDQRGTGFLRTRGFATDIGAFEFFQAGLPPEALGTAPNITATGVASTTLTVQYASGDSSINFSSLGSADITVTGPNGTVYPVTLLSPTTGSNAANITATYKFAAPGGTFNTSNIGLYTINVVNNQVLDTNASPQAVPAGTIGSFRVVLPTTFTVTTNSDTVDPNDGVLSIREALLAANDNGPAADTITFDATVFATPSTITLFGGQMAISDSVTINGGNKVTIDAVSASRVFFIDGAGTLVVNLSGLALTGGSATNGYGGAIYVGDESLTVTGLTISNSASSLGGGAIGGPAAFTLNLLNSTLSGNTVTGSTGEGGALYSTNAAQWTITNSTLSGNGATATGGNGGAIGLGSLTSPGFLVIRNSTIVGNSAGGSGGGIYTANSSLTLSNSIVAQNTSTANLPDLKAGTVLATASVIGVADAGFVLSGSGNATGTLASPLDPMVSGLSDNGGPTLTVALLAGSPALDLGAATSTLSFDQRGTGFARVSNGKVDAGAYEVQVAAPATVVAGSLVINAGAAQRSAVTSVAVSFSDSVSLTATPAFTLTPTAGGPAVTPTVTLTNGGKTAVLSFGTTNGFATSLGKNGLYTLSIDGSKLTTVSSGLAVDGDGDGTAGGTYTLAGSKANGLFRLYGDANGSGAVDAQDVTLFLNTYGTSTGNAAYRDYLDSGAQGGYNGAVDAQDVTDFLNTYGVTLP